MFARRTLLVGLLCTTLIRASSAFGLNNIIKFNFYSNSVNEVPGRTDNVRESDDDSVNEDARLDTLGLATKYGYPVEKYNVTTEDGYILGVHRLPNHGATPVFLMHGLLDSSATWVMMGPSKGFAYMLHDLGYDVWMGNARGNTYSRYHKTLNPKKASFWEFSLHEIGTRDLPVMIDFVIAETKASKIHYVGHSQGTTTFWIMCSELPEYNEKIISMQALAPVAFLTNAKSPVVKYLAKIGPAALDVFKLFGEDEFLPNNVFFKKFAEFICRDKSIAQGICTNTLFVVAGFDKAELNDTMLPVIMGHTPAGASTKQVIHFAQIKNSNKFQQYDYGFIRNRLKYNQWYPPQYDLSKVKVRAALHYGENDWFAAVKDVEALFKALPNPIGKFLVADPEFNHLDFIWAIDGKAMLYNRVVDVMRREE